MNISKQLHATEPISPLRQRMIDDMNMRRLTPRTQSDYLRHVKRFSEFFGHSPHKATAEDLRQYQLHLVSSGIKSPSINAVITALRFLFTITLDRQEAVKKLCPINEPRRLPDVLSPEEITRVINATCAFKYKTVLSVAYGTGLRAKEICHLRINNVDSANMVLHVEQGKGSKDRQAMLSLPLLTILRRWWCIARKQGLIREGGWLFPGQNPVNPVSERQLNRVCHAAASLAGIKKRVSMHTFRHSFATHLLDQGVDIRVIQVLLGHQDIRSTAQYSRVATRILHETRSPLDTLQLTLNDS